MLVCLFVIKECVLLQACMVALYGRVGTQVGHCRVDVQCRTRILHVHLMEKCIREELNTSLIFVICKVYFKYVVDVLLIWQYIRV